MATGRVMFEDFMMNMSNSPSLGESCPKSRICSRGNAPFPACSAAHGNSSHRVDDTHVSDWSVVSEPELSFVGAPTDNTSSPNTAI